MSAAPAMLREASWRERAATLMIFFGLGLDVGTWAAAIPALKSELGLDPATLSLVLLTASIASVVATMGAGVVAPRLGNGRATALAALMIVIGFASPGLAHSYGQLLVCGIVLGAAAGALEVAVNGHASDIERRWGSTIMSSFHAAFSIGGLVGASLGGLVAGVGAGLQAQLWLPQALSAVAVVVALPSLRAGARGEPGHATSFVWPERPVLLLGVIALLCYMLEGAMADWSALYMTTVASASAGAAAVGYAAFSVTMAAGRLTGDLVVARLGARRVLMAGALIAAAGLAVVVLAPAPLPVALGFALVGVGAANVVPLVFSAAGRLTSNAAAGIAMVSSFGFAGFLGGPPLIGAIATWAGLRASFAVLLVAALLIAVVSRARPSKSGSKSAGADLLPRDRQRSRRRSRT